MALRAPGGVSTNRWRDAQQAENAFWQGVYGDPVTTSRALASQVEAASWILRNAGPGGLPDGEMLEVGIGPLGMGVAQFVTETPRVVGLDPLALQSLENLVLPQPLLDAVSRCRAAGYEHRQARGEETGLETGRFGLVLISNALDHAQDPGAVLREARRVMRDDGMLFVSCDGFSLAGLARFHVWTKRRDPEGTLVKAHPFRFHPRQITAAIRAAGFRIQTDNVADLSSAAEIAGRVTLVRVLAR